MKKNIRVIILTMTCISLCLLCACSKEKENENETTTTFDMKAAQSCDRRCLHEIHYNVLTCIAAAEAMEGIAITEGDILLSCTDNDDLTIKGSTGLERFLEQYYGQERISTISKADPSKTTIKVSIRGNTKEWKVDAIYE